jgi:hypothetical protein
LGILAVGGLVSPPTFKAAVYKSELKLIMLLDVDVARKEWCRFTKRGSVQLGSHDGLVRKCEPSTAHALEEF